MLITLRKRMKAQSTAEYAIFFGIIIAVAVAMQKYVKRGLQAKVADTTDVMTTVGAGEDIGGVALGSRGQYEPYYLRDEESSQTDRTQTAAKTQTLSEGGAVDRQETQDIGVGSQTSEDWSAVLGTEF